MRNESLTIQIESFITSVLFHLTFTVVLQVLFYVFKLSFSYVSFILPFLIWPFIDNRMFGRKKFIQRVLINYISYFLLISLLMIYYQNFIDHSFDGNMYHGEVMVQLMYGWNPIYNTNLYLNSYGMVWGNLYPKFSWIIGAFFISILKSSSAGMLLNGLLAVITFIKSMTFFNQSLNKFISFAISFSILVNPIFIEQLHTLYIDGIIYSFIVLLIIYNLELMQEYTLKNQFVIILITIALINLKFSSFAFAGFIDLSAFIYYLVKNKKNAFRIFISGLIILLIGMVLVGYSPYIINILNGRNLMYPLMGKDKWDIISSLLLEQLIDLRSYQRFFYSITNGLYWKSIIDFSSVGYLLYDQRIGGFGFNFAKLLLTSSILLVIYIIQVNRKLKIEYILMFVLFSISILVNYRNIWWARYAPHLWLVVPLSLLMITIIVKRKYLKVVSIMFVLSLLLQQTIDIYKLTFERDSFVTQQALSIYEDNINVPNLEIYIDNGNTDHFIVFEEFKLKEYGLDIKKVWLTNPNKEMKCSPVEVYRICIVNHND